MLPSLNPKPLPHLFLLPPPVPRDQKLGELELAEQAVSLGAKRKMFKPKGSSEKVDRIDWLKGEVARLERAVLEARERAMVLNGTPSYFVLFRWGAGWWLCMCCVVWDCPIGICPHPWTCWHPPLLTSGTECGTCGWPHSCF